MARSALRGLLVVGLVAVAPLGCRALDPPPRPEAVCAASCEARVSHCSRAQCLRGCNVSLDRILEREGDRVVACVAHAKPACDDPTWARCATEVGPFVDGGPPAPPPPRDWDEEAPKPAGSKSDEDEEE